MEIRKAALRLLIGSIVVSGMLAIWALLAGEFGELQAKVLLSALATSGASMLGMACGTAWDRQRWPSLALGGIVLAVLTLALSLVAIWVEPEPIETFMKVLAAGWFFSTAAAHGSLLSLAPADRTLSGVRSLALGLGFVLAAGLTVLVWVEDLGDETMFLRGLGVVGVLMLMGSLSLPVLARLRGIRLERPGATVETEDVRVLCPLCGQEQRAPLGMIVCDACEARFRVEIED